MSHVTLTVQTAHGPQTIPYTFPEDRPVGKQMANTIRSGGVYEPGLTALVTTVLRLGDTAVDCGAHVGYVTKLMAVCVGGSGRVLAVEAAPWNADLLRAQVQYLPWVTVVEAAVGESAGDAVLYRNADNDGGHALWDPALHPANTESKKAPEVVTVPRVPLDRLLAEYPTPRLLKLDIEGSEVAALNGARHTLAEKPPFVICEVNRSALNWMGTSESALRTLMAGYGYECWHLADTYPSLRELGPLETVSGNYVFNVLFRQPGASLT